MKIKTRILHIDDNIHDRELVKDALLKGNEDYEIYEAESREIFEKLIVEKHFDIVLSDFNILGFDGLQVLQVVKEKQPNLPVIIVTGTGSEEIAIQAMKMGAADYVIKSVKHIQGLVPTIKTVLEHKKALEKRRLAEEALKKSEARFRSYFESIIAGIAIITPTINWIVINDQLCEMLGFSREELSKLTWSELTYPDDLEADLEQFNRILNGKSDDFHIDKRFIRKNGEIIWTSLSARCVRFSNGNVDYFITLLFDITERKKAEEDTIKQNKELEQKIFEKNIQLQSANKELEAFNNSVSNDIKSLLKIITDLTNILKCDQESSLNDDAIKICNDICSSAIKIEKLIDSLHTYSHISRCELNYTKIDMENLVNSVFIELTKSVDRNKIELTLKSLPALLGDNSTIKQSLINLISNAIKYSSKQEHIKIEVGSEKCKNEIIYYVKDNGIGFDMKYSDKLFCVFQRLPNGTEFEGTGVGLAIVQRIIHRHGGRVWAEGTIDKGATFYIALPK